MSGETDLKTILSSLTVERREQHVTMVSLDTAIAIGPGIEAVISEAEGTTVVATIDEARRRGWAIEFEAAWLTIGVHSSLEAVGLTAAMADVLTRRGIPCNVIAGYFHDHLLIPVDRADEAVSALESLAAPE